MKFQSRAATASTPTSRALLQPDRNGCFRGARSDRVELSRSSRPHGRNNFGGDATIWAIDDYTTDNGATDVIVGSHRWDGREPTQEERSPVLMRAGSCVLFLGTLWHGGGANRSKDARLAITAQYCEPSLRPQEAFTLATSLDTVRALSEDIRRMLGYSIHPPFLGQVDGMHPKRLLER